MSQLQQLADGDSPTWSRFLFNVEAAQVLTKMLAEGQGAPELAVQALVAGSQWDGHGWTTSRASRTLYQITRVPLVVPQLKPYVEAWLFALAIHWNLDVPQAQLCDRSSEAAFKLAEVLVGESPPAETMTLDSAGKEEEGAEEE